MGLDMDPQQAYHGFTCILIHLPCSPFLTGNANSPLEVGVHR